LKIIGGYYSRITLARLAQMLDLTADEVCFCLLNTLLHFSGYACTPSCMCHPVVGTWW